MKGLLRFILWGTPLTWLATTYYTPYLRFLTGVVVALFALFGIDLRVGSIEFLAPVDLAIFGALALSSFQVAWPLRLARLGLGLLVLFLLEVGMLTIAFILFLIMGVPLTGRLGLLFQNVSSVLAWAAAPMVWIALFKPRLLEHATRERKPA